MASTKKPSIEGNAARSRRLTSSTADEPAPQPDIAPASQDTGTKSNQLDDTTAQQGTVMPASQPTGTQAEPLASMPARQPDGEPPSPQDSTPVVERKIKRTYYMTPTEVELLDDFVYQETKRRKRKVTLSDAISEAIRAYVTPAGTSDSKQA